MSAPVDVEIDGTSCVCALPLYFFSLEASGDDEARGSDATKGGDVYETGKRLRVAVKGRSRNFVSTWQRGGASELPLCIYRH